MAITIPGRQTTVTPERSVSLARQPVGSPGLAALEQAGGRIVTAAINLKEQDNARVASEKILEGQREYAKIQEGIRSASDLGAAAKSTEKDFKTVFERLSTSGNSTVNRLVRGALGSAAISNEAAATNFVRKKSNAQTLANITASFEATIEAAKAGTQNLTETTAALEALRAQLKNAEELGIAAPGSADKLFRAAQQSVSADRLQTAMLAQNINSVRHLARDSKAFKAFFPGLGAKEQRFLQRTIEARDARARAEARQEAAIAFAAKAVVQSQTIKALITSPFTAQVPVPTPAQAAEMAALEKIALTPALKARLERLKQNDATIAAFGVARDFFIGTVSQAGGMAKVIERINKLAIEPKGATAERLRVIRGEKEALTIMAQSIAKASKAGTTIKLAAEMAGQPLAPLVGPEGGAGVSLRAEQASVLRAKFPSIMAGAPLVTPIEAKGLMKSLMDAAPTARLATIARMARDAGGDLAGLQVSLRDAEIANPNEPGQQALKNGVVLATGMVLDNPSAARIALAGVEAIRAETPQPKHIEVVAAITSELGIGAEITGTGAVQRRFQDGVKLMYAGLPEREVKAGETIDTTRLENAVALMTGGVIDKEGEVTGGVASVNGIKTRMPTGMEKSAFSTRLNSIKLDTLNQHANGIPHFGEADDRRRAKASEMASMLWRRRSDGLYIVTDVSGKPLLLKDGITPWVVDLEKAFVSQGTGAELAAEKAAEQRERTLRVLGFGK